MSQLKRKRFNLLNSCTVATSSFSPKKYDVFISFRGEDTRKSFTSHLHHALVSAGIRAYIDDRDLPKGDTVWEALCEAIHDSHIAIIVFSANYASSKWCLEEVMEILKCRQSEGQVVIPVFYEVDPSDIRKQSGSYEEAFSKYVWLGENSNNSILNKVPQWKAALTEIANVSGWDSRIYGTESQFIKNIVNDVSQKLCLMYPQEPKDKLLVGMDKICEEVQQLLSKKKQEHLQKNVEVIGIWGMAGIGKTTIARVLFSRLFPLYGSVCILENIKELSKNDTPSKLKALSNTLLSELLQDENIKFNPPRSTSIARRLSSKKVLIVLDDVDSLDQLDELCEVYRHAGPESTVILTTRNRHLLVGKVDEIYKAEMLSCNESLELFCLHAFKQRCPQEGYEELSKTAVDYARGVPLALKVLGSNLYSRSTEFWECELRKVKKYPHKRIDNVLRVSYDGLDIPQQKIFLDIAFFFKGECKGSVERILNACDFFATSGLEVLENKALITVSNGRIQMHDLLQDMGLNIVCKGIEDLGKRSRLADVGEISDVLINKNGGDAVEGIILNLSHVDNLLHLGADSFSMMSKLRILKLYIRGGTSSSKVIYPQVFDKISDNLRYLEWHGYGLKSLPANFSAKMLVEIHMQYSHVTELWQGVQDVVNLEVIHLQGCKHLNRLPDFSKASKLKMVNLTSCESLLAVHPSILSLDTLKTLYLDGCKKLEHLKSDKHLRSLQNLTIIDCPGLKDFSISSDEIETLYFLTAGIEKLHSSLGNLTRLRDLYIEGLRLRNLLNCRLSASLERLEIVNCRVVMDKQKLHVLLEGLTNLRELKLTDCCQMSELPDNINGLSDLERLRLDGSSVEWLAESIKHLSKLWHLGLENCRKLQWLPELPPNLRELNVASCGKLQHLPELPPNLRELNAANCSELQHLPGLPPNLRKLNVDNCSELQGLPELPPYWATLNVANCRKLKHVAELPPYLTELNVANCSELQHLPELPPNLDQLNVASCRKLKHIPELPPNLRKLDVTNCSELQHLPELPPNLNQFNVANCSELQHLPELPPNLEELNVANCSELQHLPLLPPNLRELNAANCSELQHLPLLPTYLEQLNVANCSELQHLPELPPNLEELNVDNCRKLKHIPELPPNLRELNAANCSELQHLPLLPTYLEQLNVANCSELQHLPELPPNLEELNVDNCRKLKHIPELPPNLRELNAANCSELQHLPLLPPLLTWLNAANCSKLKHILELPPNLSELNLANCSELQHLPELPPNLDQLNVNNCTKLKHVAELPPDLDQFNVANCSELHHLPELPPNLKELNVDSCRKLKHIPELPPKLRVLNAANCSELQHLPLLPPYLEQLKVDNCSELQHLPELPPHLTWLNAANCSKLKHIPKLPPNLRELNAANCSELQHLPLLPPDLLWLNAANCSKLKHIPKLPRNLSKLNVANCSELQHLPLLPPFLEQLNVANCSELQHLSELPLNLKELNVDNCIKLKYIPELPPQLRILRACNCNSLVTLSIRKDHGMMAPNIPWFYPIHKLISMLLLENCKKLDSCSFMESFLPAVMNILFHCRNEELLEYDLKVCLPESKVPTQFKYRTKGSSLTITFPPESLVCFILCAVISPSMLFKNKPAVIKCRCYPSDATGHEVLTYYEPSTDLHFDHALIWCDYRCMLLVSLGQQLSFEFSCNHWDVKECGVHPVPISEEVHWLLCSDSKSLSTDMKISHDLI